MAHAEVVKLIERIFAHTKVDFYKIRETSITNEIALMVSYRCKAPDYKIVGESIAETLRGKYELRMTSRYHDQTMFAFIKNVD